MASEPLKRIRVPQGGEIARLLDEADAAPVLLEKDGALYRLTVEPRPHGAFDPEATITSMHAAADAWKGGDPAKLKELIYRAREEGTRPS